MFKAIALICSISTPGPECTEATAIDVLRTDPGKTVVTCGLFGQAQVASTAIRPEPGKSYMKVICSRNGDAR